MSEASRAVEGAPATRLWMGSGGAAPSDKPTSEAPVLVVQGCGRTGSTLAATLAELVPSARLVMVDPVPGRAELIAASLGDRVESHRSDSADLRGVDLLVTALPAGANLAAAQHALDEGVPVVTVADSAAEVRSLFDLDAEAVSRGVAIVASRGDDPGPVVSAGPARVLAVGPRR